MAKETLVSQLSQVGGELDTVRAKHEALGAEHAAVQASHEALIAEHKVAKETLVSQLSPKSWRRAKS